MDLHNQNCFNFFEEYKGSEIDCVIVDLPYGQTDNEWDIKIDLAKMWAHLQKICKYKARFIFFCTTKFGNELINSNPSYFRYDMVWEKTHTVGYLSVKKNPLRKHEMIYVFSNPGRNDTKIEFNLDLRAYSKRLFNDINLPKKILIKACGNSGLDHFMRYGTQQFALPTQKSYQFLIDNYNIDKYNYFIDYTTLKNMFSALTSTYNPQMSICKEFLYKTTKQTNEKRNSKFPTSILKYKLDKQKLHPTQKPVKLLEWLILTYSNKGDTVLDFTMGSGSCGIACINTDRKFIGVEMDKEIFKIAKNRITCI